MAEGLQVALICWSVLLIGVLRVLFRLMKEMWLKPARIRSVLWKQGIRGPPPSFIAGNVPEMQKIQSSNQKPSDANHVHHNWVPSIFPYLQRWEQLYGPVYVYATGSKQHLYVSDPKLLKELKLQNYMDLGVPRYLSKPLQPLIGDSIIRANGQDFAYQNKVIAPEFFLNKVKGMVCLMEASAVTFLKTWESRVLESEGGVVDIKVDEELKTLSADIISRACFGSSYSQGNQIFAKIAILQEALSNPSLLFGFLNFSLFPTESEKKIKSLRKEVDALLLKLVRDRQKESQSGGSETTALTASWTLMLLALHPEWQERVRVEIAEVCGDDDDQLRQCLKDMDNLSKLKTLTMVIQESLRLYGPGVILAREALAEMKLGDFTVPEGVHIWTLIPTVHRDPENWGPDANEFKPERFANGVSEACKYPQAYVPFGHGSRSCIGQTFGMVQLKIVLPLILSKFSFSLSPNYQHSPVYKMLLLPEHGIRLLVRRVQ
ncbi:hypothetical protein CerSpe_229240 [Prunus speciosa]